MTFVTLPMYPFPRSVAAVANLAIAIVKALMQRGHDVDWIKPHLPDHEALEAHWLSPDLGLSQACGLPLVEALAGQVLPVGTFRWAEVHSPSGRYRSVIVARRNRPSNHRPLRPAINGFPSLSGWASLGDYLFRHEFTTSPPLVTGSHRASLEALQRGDADLASIDAVSWAMTENAERRDLDVIGEGPEVPGLPLIILECF